MRQCCAVPVAFCGRDKVPQTLDTNSKWLGDIVAEVSAKAQGEEDLLLASCAKYLCQRCLATGSNSRSFTLRPLRGDQGFPWFAGSCGHIMLMLADMLLQPVIHSCCSNSWRLSLLSLTLEIEHLQVEYKRPTG